MAKTNWEKILLELDENPTLTIKEVSEKYNVHRVTLSNKWNAYKLGKELYSNGEDRVIENIAKRENNIKKETFKLHAQRNELNKDIKRESIYERFAEEYIIPQTKSFKITTKPKLSNKPIKPQTFYVGDFHYRNQEESDKDIETMFNNILEQWNGTHLINLVLGGDFIENTHHKEQQIGKVTKVMTQIIRVADALANGIDELFKKTKSVITVQILEGNHDEIRQLGVKAGEDNESIAEIIYSKLTGAFKKHIKENVITINEPCLEYWKEGVHVQHGHFCGSDFIKHMYKRKEQDHNFGYETNTFIKFHSHKFEYIIDKGTDNKFITVPSIKSWLSLWESKNNQIGTTGMVVEYDGDYRVVLF